MDADERLCSAHRCDQRANADDGHDAFEIVGQHVQCHFGADPFERLRLEVCSAHPVFDGPEGMLDGFAPLAHLLRMLVEPLLNVLKDMLVFPAGDPALLALGRPIAKATGAVCAAQGVYTGWIPGYLLLTGAIG